MDRHHHPLHHLYICLLNPSYFHIHTNKEFPNIIFPGWKLNSTEAKPAYRSPYIKLSVLISFQEFVWRLYTSALGGRVT